MTLETSSLQTNLLEKSPDEMTPRLEKTGLKGWILLYPKLLTSVHFRESYLTFMSKGGEPGKPIKQRIGQNKGWSCRDEKSES